MGSNSPKLSWPKPPHWHLLLNCAFWLVLASYTLALVRWDEPNLGRYLLAFAVLFATGHSVWRVVDSLFETPHAEERTWPNLRDYLRLRFAPAGRPYCNLPIFPQFAFITLQWISDGLNSLTNPVMWMCASYIVAHQIWGYCQSRRFWAFALTSPYTRGSLRWIGEASSHANNNELEVSLHPLIGDQGEKIATVRKSILEKLNSSWMSELDKIDPALNIRARALRSIEEATTEALIPCHSYVRDSNERPHSFRKRMKRTNPSLIMKRMKAYSEAMTSLDGVLEEAKDSENPAPLLARALEEFEVFRKVQQEAGGSRCSLPDRFISAAIEQIPVEA
jgi:hypothetical protein